MGLVLRKIKYAVVLVLVALVGYAAAQSWQVSQDPTGVMFMFDSIRVGAAGTRIRAVRKGSVSLNPPSIPATSRGAVQFTLTGAAQGDVVVMVPPTTLNDDLIYHAAIVTSANTVNVYLYNPTGGAIDDNAVSWVYLWMDVT